MALDVSEKYQSQIHWPLEYLEISVPFRQSKYGELCSVACVYCVCVYIHIHTYYFCEYLVFNVYFGVLLFNLCLYRV